MFDFNFLNWCMIIQNPEEGSIEMEQFLIYIVRQSVFIPRDLVKVAQKALRIVVLIAPSDSEFSSKSSFSKSMKLSAFYIEAKN